MPVIRCRRVDRPGRRALAERLAALVDHGVLTERPYSRHPPRHDHLLTPEGEGLVPVLIALQDRGTRHVMGDGELTATAGVGSAEARRVHDLLGRALPDITPTRHDRATVDPGPLDGPLLLPRRLRPRGAGPPAGMG